MAASVGTAALFVLAALLIAVGFAGLVLPGLPGTPLVFAGLLVAAWAEGFAYVGAGTLLVLAVLTAASFAVDFLASALGARRFGASPRAVAGAVVGGLVGLFFGLPGLVLGPFAGAVAGELTARRTLAQAGQAGVGATLGLALGLAAKLGIAFAMLGLFAFDRFVWG
ncbi:MAG TPA: DUF456 domain-containing protein [Vicinamibacterales bacterium]|nr:DUF456 domain-containing protein [Vicinamibacterales bacterium]